jgi:SNF2 family DNA or RNA helicase
VSAWFPEEVSYGITYQPDDGSGPVAFPLDETVVGELVKKLEAARKEGTDSIVVPSLPRPIPVIEADRIVSSFKAAQNDLGNRRFNPENLKPIKHVVVRKQLVVRSNLGTVEYEELRGSWLHDSKAPARLPGTLKPEFPLKQHQLEGLRWLQHLWAHSPTACRGGLLADDMGLGKTIQILAFIASCLEADPVADPFLIVAPVSLLENWKEEIDKFFAPGALPVLSL